MHNLQDNTEYTISRFKRLSKDQQRSPPIHPLTVGIVTNRIYGSGFLFGLYSLNILQHIATGQCGM